MKHSSASVCLKFVDISIDTCSAIKLIRAKIKENDGNSPDSLTLTPSFKKRLRVYRVSFKNSSSWRPIKVLQTKPSKGMRMVRSWSFTFYSNSTLNVKLWIKNWSVLYFLFSFLKSPHEISDKYLTGNFMWKNVYRGSLNGWKINVLNDYFQVVRKIQKVPALIESFQPVTKYANYNSITTFPFL